MSYFFHPKAKVEYLEQVRYYEYQQKGLGRRYANNFDEAMIKIIDAPHRYRVTFGSDIRCYRIPNFPYNILYRLIDVDIEVLVVASIRRCPNYWFDRLKA